MSEKEILKKVPGTIINVYERGIIIQPDNPNLEGRISEAFSGRDYSQFKVGQRVVHVSYTWERPATDIEKRIYEHRGMTRPDKVADFDYRTYDEALFPQLNEAYLNSEIGKEEDVILKASNTQKFTSKIIDENETVFSDDNNSNGFSADVPNTGDSTMKPM